MSKGLDSLVSDLEQRQKALAENINAALAMLGLQVAGDSMENAPVDTGFLMNSHFVSVPENHRVIIGAGALYAAAVHELNTPYLLNALKAVMGHIEQIMEVFVKKAIEDGLVVAPETGDMPNSAAEGRAKAGATGD